MAGILYLIPTPLGNTSLDIVLPEETRRIAARLKTFVVEQAREPARVQPERVERIACAWRAACAPDWCD